MNEITRPPPSASTPLPASTEMSPHQVMEKPELLNLIPAGTRVYVTDLGNAPENQIVSAASRLADRGFTAVPHMAARRYPSLEAFETRIKRLALEAGVRDVLAIAGEAETSGPLTSSVMLLETGLFDQLGIRTIGVAGHPDGAPEISPEALRSFLMRKHELAEGSDAAFHIVTQFGFDPVRLNLWLDQLTAWGNQFPVHVGIAGPAKMATLVKYAAFAGVQNSLKFLKKRGGSVVSMLAGYDPDCMVQPLEARLLREPDAELSQIHVYPFGGIAKTSEWLAARGSWTFNQPDTSQSQEIAQ
ncbi:methylenetetrahydrofolate reductase [Roseibium algae]|uniref:Methylenetetrahydrofolate reductase n=1 Tax=Roseibium algae TaxID=3123038 RepID=A0ABU8TPL3_9HYPH